MKSKQKRQKTYNFCLCCCDITKKPYLRMGMFMILTWVGARMFLEIIIMDSLKTQSEIVFYFLAADVMILLIVAIICFVNSW